jgi:hypothetical protein
MEALGVVHTWLLYRNRNIMKMCKTPRDQGVRAAKPDLCHRSADRPTFYRLNALFMIVCMILCTV